VVTDGAVMLLVLEVATGPATSTGFAVSTPL
jgi:hypothetical protein